MTDETYDGNPVEDETVETTVTIHGVVCAQATYLHPKGDPMTVIGEVTLSPPGTTDGGELYSDAETGGWCEDSDGAMDWRGNDTEIPCEVWAPALGRAYADHAAMEAIHAILSGNEWSSDTAPAIAEIVAATGRTIADSEVTE